MPYFWHLKDEALEGFMGIVVGFAYLEEPNAFQLDITIGSHTIAFGLKLGYLE